MQNTTILASRIGAKKSNPALMIILVLLGVIFSGIVTNYAINAYACTPPPGSNICGDNGGDNGGDGGPLPSNGSGGEDSDWERPYDVPVYPSNVVEAPCNTWNTSGSWTKSATCFISGGVVKELAVAQSSQLPAHGTYRIYVQGNANCSPIGLNSAYSRNFTYSFIEHKTIQRHYAWMWDTLWDTGYRGGSFGIPGYDGDGYYHDSVNGVGVIIYNEWFQQRSLNIFSLFITPLGCNYPTETVGRYMQCYYGYGGDAYWSQNRGAIGSGGTHSATRGSRAGDPTPPVWSGNPDIAPTCSNSSETGGTPYVEIGINTDDPARGGATTHHGYAYYKLVPYYQQRDFTRIDYVVSYSSSTYMRGQTVLTQWTSNANDNNTSRLFRTTWYAYSCLNSIEGPYRSSGALPDRNAYFAVGACPQIINNWRCEIANPTTVGVDRATLPANSTYYPNTTTVMRNGEKVPLRFGDVRIVDNTGGGWVDVTNGAAGPGVRNVMNIAYQDLVQAGSTPMHGSDVNSGYQYFKLWPSLGSNQSQRWDTWRNGANQNVDKAISFNWSSDNASGRFVAQRQWRVTAEFLVPRTSGDLIGDSDGGGGAGFTYEWVRDTQNCYERNADGSPNLSRLLTTDSNPVAVTRSVNTDEG